jgi:hypothetical protein
MYYLWLHIHGGLIAGEGGGDSVKSFIDFC